MKDAFRKAGVEKKLQVATDGRQALEHLREGVQRGEPGPQLIILDLKLPFVMGLEVLRQIREDLGLLTVVVVMSASAEKRDVTDAYRAGANAYLVKPSDTSKLVDIVKSIKLFWLQQNVFAEVEPAQN